MYALLFSLIQNEMEQMKNIANKSAGDKPTIPSIYTHIFHKYRQLIYQMFVCWDRSKDSNQLWHVKAEGRAEETGRVIVRLVGAACL